MIEPYKFVLPVSNRKIEWKPLDVGKQLELAVMHQGNQKVYLVAALYAARICKYTTDEGQTKESCSLPEMYRWDELDYNAFSEEVDRVESERAAAYKKKEPPKVLSMKVQKAVADAREAFATALKLLDEAVEAARAAEVSANSPLK